MPRLLPQVLIALFPPLLAIFAKPPQLQDEVSLLLPNAIFPLPLILFSLLQPQLLVGLFPPLPHFFSVLLKVFFPLLIWLISGLPPRLLSVFELLPVISPTQLFLQQFSLLLLSFSKLLVLRLVFLSLPALQLLSMDQGVQSQIVKSFEFFLT